MREEPEVREMIEGTVLTKRGVRLIEDRSQLEFGRVDYLIETNRKRIAIEAKGMNTNIRVKQTVIQLISYLISDGIDEVWIATSHTNYERIREFLDVLIEKRVLYVWVKKKIKYLDLTQLMEQEEVDWQREWV